jgi:FtsZ-binding cell division protein ZapB
VNFSPLSFVQGRRVADAECINDFVRENEILKVENISLRQRNKALQETVESLTTRNAQLATDKERLALSANAATGVM